MINPKNPDKITLADLKASKMAHVFFNTFLNTTKYLEFEQRDPFGDEEENHEESVLNSNEFELSKESWPKISDWDRWAAEEYETLVLEEQQSNSISSDDK